MTWLKMYAIPVSRFSLSSREIFCIFIFEPFFNLSIIAKSPLSKTPIAHIPTPIKSSSPPISPGLSLHLSIADAALLLQVRTLAPPSTPELSLTGLSLRTRLGLSPRPPVHDELNQVFLYRGEDVTVKEKVRVESQDPSLMAVMAKLSALGHSVGGWRLKVAVVMGEDVEGEG